jgi:hypothetical protein
LIRLKNIFVSLVVYTRTGLIMSQAKGIQPTRQDENRRVVLRNDEDRGTVVNVNYFPPEEMGSLIAYSFGDDTAISEYCAISYDGEDGNIFKSLKSDLTWEDEWGK